MEHMDGWIAEEYGLMGRWMDEEAGNEWMNGWMKKQMVLE